MCLVPQYPCTQKTKVDGFEFGTKTERDTLRKQMDMYKNSLQDSLYTYTQNLIFKNRVNDVKIVAKQFIPHGTVIKTLCGQTSIIYPEHIIVCFAILFIKNLYFY